MLEANSLGFYFNSKSVNTGKKILRKSVQYVGAKGSSIIVKPAGAFFKGSRVKAFVANHFPSLLAGKNYSRVIKYSPDLDSAIVCKLKKVEAMIGKFAKKSGLKLGFGPSEKADSFVMTGTMTRLEASQVAVPTVDLTAVPQLMPAILKFDEKFAPQEFSTVESRDSEHFLTKMFKAISELGNQSNKFNPVSVKDSDSFLSKLFETAMDLKPAKQ